MRFEQLERAAPRRPRRAPREPRATCPPKQAAGDPLDPRSDIYTLGAILYEVVSLRYSVEGDTVKEVLESVKGGSHRPLAEVAPEASSSLVAVVERALALDPAYRYGSVTALADDVERVLDGQTPTAENASLFTRFGRFYVGRDPGFARLRVMDVDFMFLAGGLLGVAVGLWIAAWLGGWAAWGFLARAWWWASLRRSGGFVRVPRAKAAEAQSLAGASAPESPAPHLVGTHAAPRPSLKQNAPAPHWLSLVHPILVQNHCFSDGAASAKHRGASGSLWHSPPSGEQNFPTPFSFPGSPGWMHDSGGAITSLPSPASALPAAPAEPPLEPPEPPSPDESLPARRQRERPHHDAHTGVREGRSPEPSLAQGRFQGRKFRPVSSQRAFHRPTTDTDEERRAHLAGKRMG